MNKPYHVYEINGKKVCFHESAKIEVQVGKGYWGAYKTRHTFSAADFGQAVFHYNGINIGNGYKKRLVCETLNRRVIARERS